MAVQNYPVRRIINQPMGKVCQSSIRTGLSRMEGDIVNRQDENGRGAEETFDGPIIEIDPDKGTVDMHHVGPQSSQAQGKSQKGKKLQDPEAGTEEKGLHMRRKKASDLFLSLTDLLRLKDLRAVSIQEEIKVVMSGQFLDQMGAIIEKVFEDKGDLHKNS